jgi:hypothetical protein
VAAADRRCKPAYAAAPLRNATTPAEARSKANEKKAHCESVGTATGLHTLMALLLRVTSAVRAKALPASAAPAARVTLVSAKTLPIKEVFAERVVELTERHQTLQ